MPLGFLQRAALYYTEEPHQDAAWAALEARLDPSTLESFKDAYRGIQAMPRDDWQGSKHINCSAILDVPYFYQRDSVTGHGERMCFSSAMAMALDYLQPDFFEGDDDWYLNHVLKYGDSVDSTAQVQAARSLGFEVEFKTNGGIKDLEILLETGIPVPIGILHKGNYQKSYGGGHWICLIGHDQENFIVHDPFGHLDLVNGGYPHAGPTDGKSRKYPKNILMCRWLIANDYDGWYMDLHGN